MTTGKTEADIEKRLRERIRANGGIAYKWRSPNRRHVPDRICLLPHGRVVFVETKAPGEKPRHGQEREHKRLRKLGFSVAVVDSYEGIEELIRQCCFPTKT